MVLLLVSKRENHNAKYGFFFFFFPFSLKDKKKKKKKIPEKSFFLFFVSRTFFFFFQEQSVLSLLNLLQGLQRESKDCEKDHYKNKTRKPNNTKMPSLVSVTISLKQIRRLPGARKSHFDVYFSGYNGGQTVPQHLDTAPVN